MYSFNNINYEISYAGTTKTVIVKVSEAKLPKKIKKNLKAEVAKKIDNKTIVLSGFTKDISTNGFTETILVTYNNK
jgi:hypothetical protein